MLTKNTLTKHFKPSTILKITQKRLTKNTLTKNMPTKNIARIANAVTITLYSRVTM